MKNLILIMVGGFLCLSGGKAVAAAAAAVEESRPAKRLITQENSTLCGLQAARHAYSHLMAHYNGNTWMQTLVQSSYKVNFLEHSCLGMPEGPQWKLRGSNKATNRELLKIMATVSYPALFEWTPGALILSADDPWVSFSAGYKPHAPRTAAELDYVQQLKEECGTHQQGPVCAQQ